MFKILIFGLNMKCKKVEFDPKETYFETKEFFW